MIKVFLVLVYLWQDTPTRAPELVILRQDYATMEACVAAGQKKINEMEENPKFVGGLFADCVPASITEVKS